MLELQSVAQQNANLKSQTELEVGKLQGRIQTLEKERAELQFHMGVLMSRMGEQEKKEEAAKASAKGDSTATAPPPPLRATPPATTGMSSTMTTAPAAPTASAMSGTTTAAPAPTASAMSGTSAMMEERTAAGVTTTTTPPMMRSSWLGSVPPFLASHLPKPPTQSQTQGVGNELSEGGAGAAGQGKPGRSGWWEEDASGNVVFHDMLPFPSRGMNPLPHAGTSLQSPPSLAPRNERGFACHAPATTTPALPQTVDPNRIPPVAAANAHLEHLRPPPLRVPQAATQVSGGEAGGRDGATAAPQAGVPFEPCPTAASQRRLVRPDRVRVGGRGQMGGEYLTGTPMPGVFPTPTTGPPTQLPGARVNVIGQNGGGFMGFTNPLISEALKNSRVKKFSGRAEDFEEFERQWNFHLKLMASASQGDLPDALVLMTIKNFIDDASATLLNGKLAIDPDLSYDDFWSELRSRFLRDARATHRQNWRSTKLIISGDRVTLQDWCRFQASYVSRRALVEDWSEMEDQTFVFAQTPSEFQTKVLIETGKRRNGKHWVRVVFPPDMQASEVQTILGQEIGVPFRVLSNDKRSFVIDCHSEANARILLENDGSKVEGRVIKIQKAEYSMTGDDIFRFVQRLLETEDDLRSLRKAYDIVDDAPRGVQLVQTHPAASPSHSHPPSQGSSQGGPWGKDHWRDDRQRRSPRAPHKPGRDQPSPGKPSATKPGANGAPPPKGAKPGSPAFKFKPGVCHDCEQTGKDPHHDFKTCPVHLAAWEERKKAKAAKSKAAAPSQAPPRAE